MADLGKCKSRSEVEALKATPRSLPKPSALVVSEKRDQHSRDGVAGLSNGQLMTATATTDNETLIKNLKTTMSADKDHGLGSISPSLSDMAISIEPIMDNFNSVLVRCCPAYVHCF